MFSGFSRALQEQTENALCHQTADRRTSEQLQNLQGETQPHPSVSLSPTLFNVESFAFIAQHPTASATQYIIQPPVQRNSFTFFPSLLKITSRCPLKSLCVLCSPLPFILAVKDKVTFLQVSTHDHLSVHTDRKEFPSKSHFKVRHGVQLELI